MKRTALSLILVATIIAMAFECRATAFRSEDATYKDLYCRYRALVEKAITTGEESRLSQMTADWFNKTQTGKSVLQITVSKRAPQGEWRVLLRELDVTSKIKLPQIHHREPEDVHIYKTENYILLETGKSENGDYPGGLHIRMAIGR